MTQQQLPPPEENEEPNHDLGEEPEDHDSSARVETRPQVAPKEDLIQPIRNSLVSFFPFLLFRIGTLHTTDISHT
ncbi:hypothetical protein MJO29_016815 [Puccinia striiformis f. sp. tritici]|uniref:Uncharacterized protein n=1 Tax=Puccinia striiformis TaxID=27350 RepID=A0A2S4V050_9BASI|nr:hypothetical protein MJO29_016815 [Puccinia striiformis f. sp. tritici]POW02874.1 hypothetical protein PSHT_11909 [Puccinia striiformis]